MYEAQNFIQIAAQAMIAFLFLYRAIDAIPRFRVHAGKLRDRRIPFPEPVLVLGLTIMMAGGALVALDCYAWFGAFLLIAFTSAANYCYHHFWAMEPGPARDNHRNIFCNNIAVMGGLVLLIEQGIL